MAGNQILIYVLAFFLITTKHIRFSDHAMSYPYHHTVHPFLWPPSLLSCLKYLRFSATQSHILSHHHKVHPVLGHPISYSFSSPQSTPHLGHPISYSFSSPQSTSGSGTTHSQNLPYCHKIQPVLWPPTLISYQQYAHPVLGHPISYPLITTQCIPFSDHPFAFPYYQ